jgi:hypothetical protein
MSDTWSWDDVVWDDAPAAGRRTLFYGGNKRQDGSTRSRFVGTSAHASREAAALSADHLAVRRGRTLFPTTVISPEDAPRLLVGGHNSAKIGAKIEKGPWRGLHVYTLTLEERATCPTSCHLWRECYGNAMPLVRRHAADDTLIPTLDAELRNKARWHGARGFAVRLHVLGDFYSQVYLLAWLRWMNERFSPAAGRFASACRTARRQVRGRRRRSGVPAAAAASRRASCVLLRRSRPRAAARAVCAGRRRCATRGSRSLGTE